MKKLTFTSVIALSVSFIVLTLIVPVNSCIRQFPTSDAVLIADNAQQAPPQTLLILNNASIDGDPLPPYPPPPPPPQKLAGAVATDGDPLPPYPPPPPPPQKFDNSAPLSARIS